MSVQLETKLRRAILWLKWETSADRVLLTCRALAKSHHWLTEPRIAAGNDGAGRWTTGAGSADTEIAAEVIYICARVGTVPVRDETGVLALAVSYLCGFDNQLISWVTTTKPPSIIRDPRF